MTWQVFQKPQSGPRVAAVSSNATAFQADLNDPRHGTVNGYHNLKCSCSRCRVAWAENVRMRRGKSHD